MNTTQSRMIGVAIVVCGFAVGMSSLLNYFKYRSTANQLVTERLVVTGSSVENAIQSSLALGLQFSDIGTLPGILDRERATDSLILGIDIFDTEGKLLYSTDRLRSSRPVPESWLKAARESSKRDWQVEDRDQSAAGIKVQNHFGLTIGYLALRYSADKVREETSDVGQQIAFTGLLVFLASATLSSLALVTVMGRLTGDVGRIEAALRAGDSGRADAIASRGPFGPSLIGFLKSTRLAEAEVARLHLTLRPEKALHRTQSIAVVRGTADKPMAPVPESTS